MSHTKGPWILDWVEMVYIINKVPKVVQVSLSSKEMNDAANVYMTEGEAYSALQ
ncbi:hypothetical protein D3C77_383610 [compost metagenome]